MDEALCPINLSRRVARLTDTEHMTSLNIHIAESKLEYNSIEI